MTSADEQREALGRAIPPAWASEWGEDADFGPFAVLRIGAASQRFRWIAPGTFMMGAGASDTEAFELERPRHEVTLTRGFWLADTPCTQAMWEAVMGTNPSRFKGPRRPVERVSAEDVDAFVARLTEYGEFRLPSEAQWEYACRAGTTTPRHGTLDAIAWHAGNSNEETHEVGDKLPNTWGLYDMLGNVWEWVADRYGPYGAEAIADPHQGHGRGRVHRGGSWSDHARYVRAAFRYWFVPGSRGGNLGFRLAGGQEIAPSPGERSDQPARSRGAREASKGRGGAPTGADRRSPKQGK